MDYSNHLKGWNDFKIGDTAEWAKTITHTDVVLWSGITCDTNPVYLDEEYARHTEYGQPLVPPVFILGFISTAITRLGMGHVYAAQDIKFELPVFVGDTITGRALIVEKMAEKHMLKVATTCTNDKGNVVMEGEALLYVTDHEA